MHAIPEPLGAAAVLVAYPEGTALVAIANVTVPGAILFACDGITAAVAKKVLTGKDVPLKVADACGALLAPPVRTPLVNTFAGFRSIRNRPSPCVPAPPVTATVMLVEPGAHPELHVPSNTRASSRIWTSIGCAPP